MFFLPNTSFKYIFNVKILLLVTLKSDQDPDRIRICIGLAPWIRIPIEIKSWIRIRIEANAEPQHWCRYGDRNNNMGATTQDTGRQVLYSATTGHR
jgi:hypothetical protein